LAKTILQVDSPLRQLIEQGQWRAFASAHRDAHASGIHFIESPGLDDEAPHGGQRKHDGRPIAFDILGKLDGIELTSGNQGRSSAEHRCGRYEKASGMEQGQLGKENVVGAHVRINDYLRPWEAR